MKYLAVIKMRALAGLVYERDVAVRSVFMLVALITFVQLWTTTFAATGQSLVQGFSLRDLVWYLVVTETVALSTPRIVSKIDAEVRGGDVAYSLAHPINYPLFHLSGFWGETIVRLPLNAGLGACVGLIAVGPPAIDPIGLTATVGVAGLAITLRGCVDTLIGLSAFWLEDTLPIDWLHNKFLLTLGGTFIPLELFPSWLGSIARMLPFASIQYAPARVFVGAAGDVLATIVLSQLIWLGLAWLLVQFVFARAARRLVAHGG